MKDLRIWFTDFWGLFDKQDNLFTWALKHKYNVIVGPDNPDIVISCNPQERHGDAIIISYSGEPLIIEGCSDYIISSFYKDDSRYFRLPLYLLYNYDLFRYGVLNSFNEVLIKERDIDTIYNRQKFCTFLAQGGGNNPRERFVDKLSLYKTVDCAGRFKNNYPIVEGEPGTIYGSISKIRHLQNYKFTIAFENSCEFNGLIGYTTEKIFEPFVAYSIPVYWGNPNIHLDFNSDCFINWWEFGSDEKTIEKIIQIDNDKDLFSSYFLRNFVQNNELFSVDYVLSIFNKILK
jgi:hypothetical protein